MSLIIKGVDMPSKCRFCPCCADNGLIGMQREYFCSAVDSALEIDNLDQKLSACPLAEIPTPHGRLLDDFKLLRALINAFPNQSMNFYDTLERVIDEAPTIIEAEASE